MSAASAKLSVWTGEHFACVKIAGRATFTSSLDLKTLIDVFGQKGITRVVFDLSECALMDSTFLGVLAGLGLRMNPTQAEACAGAVELLNPSDRILELLDSLGVLQFFRVTHGELALPEPVESQPYAPCAPSKQEVTQACLEAHQTLMALNPANVAKFQEVSRFLAEGLKNLPPEPKRGGTPDR